MFNLNLACRVLTIAIYCISGILLHIASILALETFPYEISLWKRYVDDTIVILMDAFLNDFTAHINVVHPAIRFKKEEDGRLAVLDTQMSRREDRLTFSVYRKPTHTDQYLQFCSSQPLRHKLGVIRMLAHWCATICKDRESWTQETQHLKKVLSVSGYTKKAWKVATGSRPRTRSSAPVSSGSASKGSVVIPYVGQVEIQPDSSPFPQ